jgi:hypothetical protein
LLHSIKLTLHILLLADGESSDSMIPEQIAVSPEFQKKMDEWERTRSIKCNFTEY